VLSWVLPGFVGALVLAVAGAGFYYGPRMVPPPKKATAATAVAAPPRPLADYGADKGGPLMAPVDVDTTDDVVSLRWDDANEARPLWVAAHDGRTMKELWRTGPFAITWGSPRVQLARAGDRIFLADGSDKLHVIELGTGRELKAMALSFRIDRMCADPKTHTAWVSRDDEHQAYVVDADSEVVRMELTPPRWCRFSGAVPHCGYAEPGEPCTYPSGPGPKLIDFTHAVTYLDGDDGVSIGLGKVKKPLAQAEPFLLGFDRSSYEVKWELPVVDRSEAAHEEGAYKVHVAPGRVYAVYQRKGGAWSLIARDLRSGRPAFVVPVPGDTGSGLVSLTVTPSRALVAMRRKIHVFDATDGRHLGSID
jgi:hypothetical protein